MHSEIRINASHGAKGGTMRVNAIIVVAAYLGLIGSALGAPPNWSATVVDQSWRNAPSRLIIEEVSRLAGVRPLLDDAMSLRLDTMHITLLARKQPVAVLLKRIGELTDTDIVVVGERLVAYEHGRVPGLLIVANELKVGDTVVAQGSGVEDRRHDCEWIDLSVAAITAEMTRVFGTPVMVSSALQGRQELLSFTATQATLDQAVGEVCRQLDCTYGWLEGAIVIGQNGPAVPKHTGRTEGRENRDRLPPLRLAGEVLTWQDLAHLTETGSGRDVILPEAQRGRSVGRIWADGDAQDVLVARAMWASKRLSVDTTDDSLALHEADDEGVVDPE